MSKKMHFANLTLQNDRFLSKKHNKMFYFCRITCTRAHFLINICTDATRANKKRRQLGIKKLPPKKQFDLEVVFGHELNAMVRNPVQTILRKTVRRVDLTITITDGSNFIFATELEFTHGIEQRR